MGAGKARGSGKVTKAEREAIRARLLWLKADWGIETAEKFADELGCSRPTIYSWLKEGGKNGLPDSASLIRMAIPAHTVSAKRRPIRPTWLLTGEGQPYMNAERPVSHGLARNLKDFLVDRIVADGTGTALEVGRWLPDGAEMLEVLVRLARERSAYGRHSDTETTKRGLPPVPLAKIFPANSTLTAQSIMSGLPDLKELLREALTAAGTVTPPAPEQGGEA